tara:strand:- start:404 stop:934 length:531 start_codon:yes stop_codon:yes gene_type:complete
MVVSTTRGQLQHWFTVHAVVSKINQAMRPPIDGSAHQLMACICLSCSALVRSMAMGSHRNVASNPNRARACRTGCASFWFCKDIHCSSAVIKILKLIGLSVMKNRKAGALTNSFDVMPKTISREGVAVVMRFSRQFGQLHGQPVCPAQLLQADSLVSMRRGYAEAVAAPKVSDESH